MKAEQKLKGLKETLRGMRGVVVAYSGGVDSTFLLRVAREVLGKGVLAVTASSPIFPRRELRQAQEMARKMEAWFRFLPTAELSLPQFVRNQADRCYHCKKMFYSELQVLAARERMSWVVDGSTVDDLENLRPGRKAAGELSIKSPLLMVGLSKSEIRLLSKKLKLPTWNKPSEACLATRVPYGIPLNQQILERIERGEDFLLSLGLRQVRLRHHGKLARIEVQPQDIGKLVGHREEVVSQLKDLGYAFVALDLEGYSSGSLNRLL